LSHFVALKKTEETDHLPLIRKLNPRIQDLVSRGAIITSVATDNASNLERAFNPDELRESLTECIGRPIAHVHCGVINTNLAL
jgi:hypothetical protein